MGWSGLHQNHRCVFFVLFAFGCASCHIVTAGAQPLVCRQFGNSKIAKTKQTNGHLRKNICMYIHMVFSTVLFASWGLNSSSNCVTAEPKQESRKTREPKTKTTKNPLATYSLRFATVTARTAWKGTIFPRKIAPEVIPSRSCFEIGI